MQMKSFAELILNYENFEAKPDILASLLDIAKIQNTEASNKIEGIITTEAQLKGIVQEKAMPMKLQKHICNFCSIK